MGGGGTNRRVILQRHPPLGGWEEKGEREREKTGRLIDRSGIPKIRHRVAGRSNCETGTHYGPEITGPVLSFHRIVGSRCVLSPLFG